jgi:hypothetical protein
VRKSAKIGRFSPPFYLDFADSRPEIAGFPTKPTAAPQPGCTTLDRIVKDRKKNLYTLSIVPHSLLPGPARIHRAERLRFGVLKVAGNSSWLIIPRCRFLDECKTASFSWTHPTLFPKGRR